MRNREVGWGTGMGFGYMAELVEKTLSNYQVLPLRVAAAAINKYDELN